MVIIVEQIFLTHGSLFALHLIIIRSQCHTSPNVNGKTIIINSYILSRHQNAPCLGIYAESNSAAFNSGLEYY